MFTLDPIKAADAYYRKGKLAKAAAAYSRGGSHEQAARIWIELAETEKAVEAFTEAGLHEEAGDLLSRAGKPRRALSAYERAGSLWKAAKMAAESTQWQRAGTLFQKAGATGDALEAFEKADAHQQMLQLLRSEVTRLEGQPDRDSKETVRRLVLKQAEVYFKLKRLAEAAQCLVSIGEHLKAAPLFERVEMIDEAVSAYLEANRPAEAKRLLSKSQSLDVRTRAQVMIMSGAALEAAELYRQAGLVAEGADALEAAGRAAEAAELWEQANEHERAAHLYHRSGDSEAAARCFESAGMAEQAAMIHREAGRHDQAGRAFAEAGRRLEAASELLLGGLRDEAIECLQVVSPEDPDFLEAVLVLVPLLLENGMGEAAARRLQLLKERGEAREPVRRNYWEARVHESLGELLEARALYQQVLALDRGFQDAVARLEGLQSAVGATSGTLTSTGSFRTGLATGPVSNTGSHDFSGVAGGTTVQPAMTAGGGHSGPLLTVGSTLAQRYLVEAELGKGAMGAVYRAHDRVLDDVVAIKTLITSQDPEGELRLLREVQISRKITHSNVVRVFDVGQFPGGIFVTMEFLEGNMLEAYIQPGLALEVVRQIVAEMAAGLAEAHRLKIIHRDLKPQNVMVASGRVKILDFGIARMEEGGTDLTQPGSVLGSPKYMSPEQIRGEHLDARTDLYALGVITYALLTGAPPFDAPTVTAICMKHLTEEIPPLEGQRPGIPPEWVAFVRRATAKDAAERYQTAEEMAAAVGGLPV